MPRPAATSAAPVSHGGVVRDCGREAGRDAGGLEQLVVRGPGCVHDPRFVDQVGKSYVGVARQGMALWEQEVQRVHQELIELEPWVVGGR